MSYAGPVSRRTRTSETASRSADLTASSPETSAEDADSPAGAGARSFRPIPRYSTNEDRATIFAAGLALGLALGAGAALLFAPQSGAETRQGIARRGRRLKRRSRDSWDDLREELRSLQRKALRRRAASSL